jgi:hypothetical protein
LEDGQPEPPPGQSPPADEGGPLVYTAAELLQGRREVWIEHGDSMYCLRVTRSGKLYLTK